MESRYCDYFCDLCIKEVEAGRRPTTYLDRYGYENLITNMKNATGRVYTRAQLKNKWDGLKNDWKLWKQLIGKETGLGWNITNKKTIDASDDWWTSKLQSHPNAAKFRVRGIEPELEEKLNRIFMNTVATGEYAWTPSSGVLPFESEPPLTQVESSDESDDPMVDKLPEEKNGKRSTTELENPKKKVKKGKAKMKGGAAAKMSDQISRLVDAVERRSTGASSVKNEIPVRSITEAVGELDSLPGLEFGSELYFFATSLFMDKEKREMFFAMGLPERQLKWRKYEHSLEKSS